jgi:hypothetical protein
MDECPPDIFLLISNVFFGQAKTQCEAELSEAKMNIKILNITFFLDEKSNQKNQGSDPSLKGERMK